MSAPTPSTPVSSSPAMSALAPAAPSAAPFVIDPAKALVLSTLRVGQHLSDYSSIDLEIRRIVWGGFGLVFLGFDHKSGRPYVLKTVRPDLLAAAPDPARLSHLFLREALTWVGLWPHAHLLTAQYATQIHGVLFLVLDYAMQGSLRDLLARPDMRGRPLPLHMALEFAQQIAAGLVALHTPDPARLREQPLVHRDLKPENVLLDEHGLVKITDFGLAKVLIDARLGAAPADGLAAGEMPLPGTFTATSAWSAPAVPPAQPVNPADRVNTYSQRYHTQRGVGMGTLAYMAPEQWIDAASAGPPADLYAFGLMLSELFAGRHALLDLDVPVGEEQWRLAHFHHSPRSLQAVVPSVPAAIEHLYQRLLSKRAEARPDAAEALAVLQAAALTLGEEPYTVQEVCSPTTENERNFWQSWADTYDFFGLYAEALERIDRALAFEPYDPSVLSSRGDVLTHLGHFEEALASYAAALEALPLNNHQSRSTVYSQRGNLLCRRLGRFAEAEAAYAEALTLVPDDPVTYNNRSLNQVAWGHSEVAAQHLEEARGRFRLALQYAQRALQLNPHDPNHPRLVATCQRQLASLGEA